MRVVRQSSGQYLDIGASTYLDKGAQGEVHRVKRDLVAKVYHNPNDFPLQKLAVMIANPPTDPLRGQGHISIAWPVDLLRSTDNSHRAMGFLMPFVSDTASLDNVYIPRSRKEHYPLFNYRYLLRTARNIAAAIHAVHIGGYVIGDINESNIRVANTALVTLIDTDSFQVRDPKNAVIYRCPVGKPEFTPPELQGKSLRTVDRNPTHDAFGLAVLIFQLLMEGTHPFAGVYTGHGEPPAIEQRIAAGHFPYSTARHSPYRPMPLAPPIGILNPVLQQLFMRCFVDGHIKPNVRPDAQTWMTALERAENA